MYPNVLQLVLFRILTSKFAKIIRRELDLNNFNLYGLLKSHVHTEMLQI